MKKLLVILVMVVMSVATVSFGAEPTNTYGIATIDGVMSPGEWDNAVKIDFQANVPPEDGGGTTPATLYVMNDGINLYLAVKIARSSFGLKTQFFSEFDNNGNGVSEHGDDSLAMSVGNTEGATFSDRYRYACPGSSAGSAGCGPVSDTYEVTGGILPVGTSDGAVAASNNGSVTIIELSHFLIGTDTLHDFSLRLGDKVGHRHTLRFFRPNCFGPACFIDTVLPVASTNTGYGQYTIASPPVARVMQIGIDIKPGGNVNSINMKSQGKIPVAILSADNFNAPAEVDCALLKFGRTGDEASLASCGANPEDVNGDGRPDLVCHFTTQLTGFQIGDTEGILKGQTKERTPLTAKDAVRIVK